LHVETHGRDHLHVETHGRYHLHVETHGRVSLQQPPKQPPKQSTGRFIGSPRLPKSLSSFIAGYKSVVTTKINRLIIEKNGQIFTRNNRLWQRNFHDRVIRNLDEYRRIKSYIESNPMKW
ncbi:MAG: transposase, partial [Bacteroidota bacterium]|nr:transposase [Bacteroidota bacterium]